MNTIVQRIRRFANETPTSFSYTVYDKNDETNDCYTDSLTWEELNDYSDRLGGYIFQKVKTDTPIVVYGHKSKYMLVCFMACIKSGHAYCPVDAYTPSTRVQDIIDIVNPEIILSTVSTTGFCTSNSCSCMDIFAIQKICSDIDQETVSEQQCIKPKDVYYIIFTSGSTGKPKGVQITTECLENYLKWAVTIGNNNFENKTMRFLNQAPFSFDLSVMDLYLSLYTGGLICAITKEVQMNPRLLFKALSESGIHVWVSTPSFVDVCLADNSFNDALIPGLTEFLFCGEVLTNNTVKRLKCAFPNSNIVNTYGPTESTVCVTEVVIDEDILDRYNPLPVGMAKPGTEILIINDKGENLPEGEQGEIIIAGDTVSVGYYKDDEQTTKAFSSCVRDGQEYRLYHTGDKGYIEDGQLFYCGRIDFQIKLHGFRIEIEDIENNLLRVKGVNKAVVLPNYDQDNRVKSLTAYVVYDSYDASCEFQLSQRIKHSLGDFIPDYMVPKKIRFVDFIPMTINGKVDRKALRGL